VGDKTGFTGSLDVLSVIEDKLRPADILGRYKPTAACPSTPGSRPALGRTPQNRSATTECVEDTRSYKVACDHFPGIKGEDLRDAELKKKRHAEQAAGKEKRSGCVR